MITYLSKLKSASVVAVDTEWARNNPWCLSFSIAPGTSRVIMAENEFALNELNSRLSDPDVLTIIHNSLYDLPVLDQMGIRPAKVADSMVAAYLLQTEPQGLKPLAYRHCGMEMQAYSEVVAPATYKHAMEYITKVASRAWPDPDPVLEWKDGEPHVRKPQNIRKKALRILKGVENKGDDPAEKWKAIKEGKEVVEAKYGPLQEGELCDIPLEKAIWYSARDADATIRVWPILWDRICAMGLEGTFWRDMRALPMVVDMMGNGMPVNLESFAEVGEYFQRKMDELQDEMQRSIGHFFGGKRFNPGSNPQVAAVVYDHLRLQEKRGKFKSKKGNVQRSTAAEVLKRYKDLHPFVQWRLDWKEYEKLLNTYAKVIPQKADPDGRVRTTLRITRVATGRLSSSSPNLLAQPTRSDEGRKVRDCYECKPGRVFLSGDYEQVEFKVVANESKDEKLLEIFYNGHDIHAKTASDMFGVPLSQVDDTIRRPAKSIGFGILYMITAEGLHRELEAAGVKGWTVDRCSEAIREWFNIYKGVAAYMKSLGAYVRRYGYVRDMWGRVRYIPGIRSTNKWIRLEAERQAGNAPIQMGAQGIIKDAMGRLVPVYRRINEEIGMLKPLLQIHDDLLWETEEWMVPIVKPILHEEMCKLPPNFIVPLEVDFKGGPKWGSMSK